MFCVSVLSVNCKSILYIFHSLHTFRKRTPRNVALEISRKDAECPSRVGTTPEPSWLRCFYLPPNMLKVRYSINVAMKPNLLCTVNTERNTLFSRDLYFYFCL